MRTLLRLFPILFVFLVVAAPQNAHALIISTNVTITASTTFNEDVVVITGGTLHIVSGVTVTLTAGHSIAVTNGGVLNLNATSTIVITQGAFFTTTGSTVWFGSSTTLHFLLGGTLHLMGGSMFCTDSRIIGASPTYTSEVIMDAGWVLQGVCTIYNTDISINAAQWGISSWSEITLVGICNISDPTGSNAHYIRVNGLLRFRNGTFDINTVTATRITDIRLYDDGEFHTRSATIDGMPMLTAVGPTCIYSEDCEWRFETLQGIDTQGRIGMLETVLTSYNLGDGWRGINFHDSDSLLTLEYTKLIDVYTYGGARAITIYNTISGITHIIDHCTISEPTDIPSGTAVYVEGPSGTIDVLIECTFISQYKYGVHGDGNSNIEIINCEIVENEIGCYFIDNQFVLIFQSSISYNNSMGVWCHHYSNNNVTESDVHDNGDFNIYVEDNSVLSGDNNNIYAGAASPIYLVAAYNNSTVDLPGTWWAVYPPTFGNELWVDGTSVFTFSYVLNPYSIQGYMDCGIVYPKSTPHNNTAVLPQSMHIETHNYPNPFNPSTQIEFTLPESMRVILMVYDMNGKCIATLADGVYDEGTHTVRYTASASTPSGVYMYVLHTPYGNTRNMMMLAK